MDKPNIKNIIGLSRKEADERLRKEGYNEIPSTKKRSVLRILVDVIREPMLLLLIGSGTIYLFLGSTKDALMLSTFVLVVVGITFYQERRTERALEALKDLSSPRALVIRDGEQIRVAGRDVVRDDILILKEGDRVPADAVILSENNLLVDESLLTGESVPVQKSVWDGKTKMGPPGGENLPFVYSGTLVVQGHGIARVKAVGIHTEMGKIGRALRTIPEEETLLQKETKRLVRDFALIGLSLSLIIVFIYGFVKGNWLGGFLAGLTLGMAMLPEEFSVVLIIFLTLGAWRISKKRVLTRRASAIETLGSATVLCVDKTGTLTLNRMVVDELYTNGKLYKIASNKDKPIPEFFHKLIEFSLLASQKDPFDPLEKAIKNLSEKYLSNTEHIHHDWSLIQEYPLSKNLMAISNVWVSPDKKTFVIAAKGAPESIADLCHLDSKQKKELLKQVHLMAKEGLRILGVAKAYFEKTALPEKQHDFNFELVGLIGLNDPIRSTVPAAIKECYSAGIRVIMITGDYPGTAQNIAHKIGLQHPDEFITGAELNSMDDSTLQERIKTVNIFARAVPEQKLRIVNALKGNKEIVAMTGDGVNDAPALKAAHIGIAMGERGTDVAREASALVLLNDDFSSIVSAIRLGRRIYTNLKKAMSYIFGIHIPIAGMSLIPILFNLPIVLLPAHIAFLELIIDPACSVVFEAEPEEKFVMERPPRNLKEPMFNKKTLTVSLLQGISVLFIILLVFVTVLYRGKGATEARTITFTSLVITNLALILINRSSSLSILEAFNLKNKAFWLVTAGALTALALVLYIPFFRGLFHFSILGVTDILIAFIAGIVSIIWFELLKMVVL